MAIIAANIYLHMCLLIAERQVWFVVRTMDRRIPNQAKRRPPYDISRDVLRKRFGEAQRLAVCKAFYLAVCRAEVRRNTGKSAAGGRNIPDKAANQINLPSWEEWAY